jgi:multiple sugar transport system substrate-binding protein
MMNNEITRRDALALGVSAAALATTGASAEPAPSAIKAADVAAPALPIEKGASLRMLRPVRFVKADEDVFRATPRNSPRSRASRSRSISSAGKTSTSRPR